MSIGELLSEYGNDYITALFTTWKLTFISFALAIVIGMIITVMRISPIRPMRILGNGFVQIFRNIPGAALLILLVYAFPYLDYVWSYEACVLITTTLIPAAFASEYLISGVNTVSKGQIEAARALGMVFMQIVRNIILPQAIRSSVLSLSNLCVATMLTTAIASQVPLKPRDLTGLVSHINSHDVGGVKAFAISAVLYLITAVIIGQIGNAIDKKVRIKR